MSIKRPEFWSATEFEYESCVADLDRVGQHRLGQIEQLSWAHGSGHRVAQTHCVTYSEQPLSIEVAVW